MERYFLYTALTLIICTLMVGCADKLYNKYNIPKDNPVEQAVEEAIKEETGIIVDFTE